MINLTRVLRLRKVGVIYVFRFFIDAFIINICLNKNKMMDQQISQIPKERRF